MGLSFAFYWTSNFVIRQNTPDIHLRITCHSCAYYVQIGNFSILLVCNNFQMGLNWSRSWSLFSSPGSTDRLAARHGACVSLRTVHASLGPRVTDWWGCCRGLCLPSCTWNPDQNFKWVLNHVIYEFAVCDLLLKAFFKKPETFHCDRVHWTTSDALNKLLFGFHGWFLVFTPTTRPINGNSLTILSGKAIIQLHFRSAQGKQCKYTYEGIPVV